MGSITLVEPTVSFIYSLYYGVTNFKEEQKIMKNKTKKVLYLLFMSSMTLLSFLHYINLSFDRMLFFAVFTLWLLYIKNLNIKWPKALLNL